MRNATLAAFLFLGGCGTSSTGQVSLSPRASDSTSALLSAETPAGSSTGLSIKRVRILVNEAELRGGGKGIHAVGDASMCHGGNHPGGAQKPKGKVEQGPFIVDLNADTLASGKATEPLVIADVPAGEYRGSELEIEPLEQVRAFSQVEAPGPAFNDFKDGSTAIVEGSYQGTPFVFKASFKAEQESTTAFKVTAGKSVSLALNVDASTWFIDAAGKALDPTKAENHAAISSRIQASLTIDPDADRESQHH